MNYEATIRQLKERRDFYAAAVHALEKIHQHENGGQALRENHGAAAPKRRAPRTLGPVEDVMSRRQRLIAGISQAGRPLFPHQIGKLLGYTVRQKRSMHNDLIALERTGQLSRTDVGWRSNVPDDVVPVNGNGAEPQSVQ